KVCPCGFKALLKSNVPCSDNFVPPTAKLPCFSIIKYFWSCASLVSSTCVQADMIIGIIKNAVFFIMLIIFICLFFILLLYIRPPHLTSLRHGGQITDFVLCLMIVLYLYHLHSIQNQKHRYFLPFFLCVPISE